MDKSSTCKTADFTRTLEPSSTIEHISLKNFSLVGFLGKDVGAQFMTLMGELLKYWKDSVFHKASRVLA